MRQWTLTLLLAAALMAPRAARGQALAATAGVAGGAAAGVVVTMGWVVERATVEQQFLHHIRELVGPLGAPVILGPATGLALALTDEEMLASVGTGAGAGLLVGAATGVGLGQLLAGDQTGRWAGGIMGAAAGVLVGATVGAVIHDDDPGDPGGADASALRVPVGVTVRF